MNYMTTEQIAESCIMAAKALGSVKPRGMGDSLSITQAEECLAWAAERLLQLAKQPPPAPPEER